MEKTGIFLGRLIERYWEICLLHVQFAQVIPRQKKFSVAESALHFEMLAWKKLIEILQTYDRMNPPIFVWLFKKIKKLYQSIIDLKNDSLLKHVVHFYMY